MNTTQRIENIVQEHVLLSLGAGLVPVPGVDLAAVTIVQSAMLKKLCAAYEKDFSKSEAEVLLTALTGSTLAQLGASLLKALPGIGTIIGGVSMSIMAGASTYAVAQVAILHFESGGSLFDVNINKAKETYEDAFQKGKEYASHLKQEQKASKHSADSSGASDSSENLLDKLEQLAQLKEKGLITEEEFTTHKQRLLDRLSKE